MSNKNEHIGQLRERVTVQGVTETQSASGYPSESWSTLSTRWAEAVIKDVYSGESEESGQKTSTLNGAFRLRYDATITEKNRLSYDGRLWDIVSVVPDAMKMYMTINARSRK